MKLYRKISERYKVLGFWPTLTYLLFTVFLEKLGFHIDAYFIYKQDDMSKHTNDGFSFKLIRAIHELGENERVRLIEYGGTELIDEISDSFSRGELCGMGFSDQQLGCVCWAKRIENYPVNNLPPSFLIWRCFTLPDLRGRGLYPLTLSNFCSVLKDKESFSGPILIESSIFNHSSLKGIHKAGFRYQGNILRFGCWSKAFNIRNQ